MKPKTDFLPTLYKASTNGTLAWKIGTRPQANGSGVLVTVYGLEGGKMQTLEEEISAGKNVGKKNETTPYAQAVAEAQSRWNKQLSRKGYGLDATQSSAVRSASPMLAKTYGKDKCRVDWSNAYAQPKLDGFRALARLSGGRVEFTSRENQPMPALAHLGEHLKGVMDGDTVFDGEMYCHGMPLNRISSACKKKSDLTERIGFHVYDVVSKGPFRKRKKFVEERLAGLSDGVSVVPTVLVSDESQLMFAQREFLDEGYEGAMLRHGSDGYDAGKRSSQLLKVKTFQDAEFTVVDYKMGRGKYAGVPIFVCRTRAGHVFDVTAPGDMEEKRRLGDSAADCVGRLLKVKFFEFTKTEQPVPFLPSAVCFL